MKKKESRKKGGKKNNYLYLRESKNIIQMNTLITF